jgi:hypothetical protein
LPAKRRRAARHVPGESGNCELASPSYSPRTGLFYIPTWANYSVWDVRDKVEHVEEDDSPEAARAPVPGIRAEASAGRRTKRLRRCARSIEQGALKWE